MSLTINHQTNDISATSGSVTIDGAAVSGGDADSVDGKSIAVVTALPSSPDANTIYFVTG